MTDPKRVFIMLGPNHVAEGFYVYADGVVTMTYANGEPVLLDHDEPVTATAAPEMIEPVARALTRRIHKREIGDSVPGFGHGESVGGWTSRETDGFGRALSYKNEGWI